MNWIKLILIMVSVYIFALVVTLPASQVFSWVKPKQAKLYEISGTPWSGKAKVAVISGIRFENVKWSMQIFPLILGRLQYAMNIPIGKGDINVSIGRGITGATYIQDINGTLPVQDVLEIARMGSVLGEGKIRLKDVNLQLTKDAIKSASGEIKWVKAKLDIIAKLNLGDITAKLSKEENKLKAMISSSGKDAIGIDGVFSLTAAGNYNFKGKISAKNNDMINQMLKGKFRKGRDGKFAVNYKGRIPVKFSL